MPLNLKAQPPRYQWTYWCHCLVANRRSVSALSIFIRNVLFVGGNGLSTSSLSYEKLFPSLPERFFDRFNCTIYVSQLVNDEVTFNLYIMHIVGIIILTLFTLLFFYFLYHLCAFYQRPARTTFNSGGVSIAPEESGFNEPSTSSVSADLPMPLLSVFSNYWHRFII